MFPLIINVACVPITVNGSACGVPAVFWALSHGKCCPVSFVKEDARNKKQGRTSQCLFISEQGPGVGNCMWSKVVVLDGMAKFLRFLDGVLGRKVENEECLEMTVNYIVLQLYLWTQMFMQNNQMKRY